MTELSENDVYKQLSMNGLTLLVQLVLFFLILSLTYST